MIRFMIVFLLLALPVAASAGSFPEQDTAAQRITLEEAIKLAMERNPELRTARLEVDRADSRVMEAIGTALPALDLTGRYTHALEKPVFFLPDFADLASGKTVPVKIGSNFSMEGTIAAKQILFNGAVFVGVGAASIYSNLARDLYVARQVETVTKVRKAFYSAALAGEALTMMRQNLATAEDNLRNVRLLRSQGVLSEYEELRASLGVANLQPAVLQSEANYGLSLDNLRNVIGLDASTSIRVDDPLTFQAVDDTVVANAEALMLDVNPNLQAVKRQMNLNDAAVFAERSSYLPIVSAFGQYQFQAAKNEFNFNRGDFIRSSQVGISVSLNVFQGFQTYSRVEQAQLERRKSEEQHVSLERSLRMGLNSVKGNLGSARKRIDAQDKTVETAERGYKIVTTRFLASAATQLEVNDAQLALMQARVNRLQAIYDYLVAAADLDQFLGRVPAYVNGLED